MNVFSFVLDVYHAVQTMLSSPDYIFAISSVLFAIWGVGKACLAIGKINPEKDAFDTVGTKIQAFVFWIGKALTHIAPGISGFDGTKPRDN